MKKTFPWLMEDKEQNKREYSEAELDELFPWRTKEGREKQIKKTVTVRGIPLTIAFHDGEVIKVMDKEIVRFSDPDTYDDLQVWTNDGSYIYGTIHYVEEYIEDDTEYWIIETSMAILKFRIVSKPEIENESAGIVGNGDGMFPIRTGPVTDEERFEGKRLLEKFCNGEFLDEIFKGPFMSPFKKKDEKEI